MPDILTGKPNRRGSQGRIPDAVTNRDIFVRVNVTLPPDILERLTTYCNEEERARSWVIQKSVDEWLKSKGY